MIHRIRFAAAGVLLATLMAGCASSGSSGASVRADYDRAADFGKYKTYGFVGATAADRSDFQSLGQQVMQRAAAREMEARGYTRSDTPDLVINFKGKLEEKTDIQSTPAPYYGPTWGYSGWYGAPYGGWGMGMGGTEVTTKRYNVGTLVMDVVDREKRQVVYQGGVEGVVSKKMMNDRETLINSAVAKLFTKYPFVAGQGTPVTPAPKK